MCRHQVDNSNLQYVRVTICCCTSLPGGGRTSPRDAKKEDECRVHSCVIVSLTALLIVYCKHPYANHYLSFLSVVWLHASMLPWAGLRLFVEACTHMQEYLLMHTGGAHLCTLTHMHTHINNFLSTPTQIVHGRTYDGIHVAILASSESPNHWPRGHNRISTCPLMYQSVNLSSSWSTSSMVCTWTFSRCWCPVLEVWDSFLTGRPSMLEGMAKRGSMHCLTRCEYRCVCLCVSGRKKETRREREEDSKGE